MFLAIDCQGFYFSRYRFKVMSMGRTRFPLSGTKPIFFHSLYQETFAFGKLGKKLILAFGTGKRELEAKHLSHHQSVQSQ